MRSLLYVNALALLQLPSGQGRGQGATHCVAFEGVATVQAQMRVRLAHLLPHLKASILTIWKCSYDDRCPPPPSQILWAINLEAYSLSPLAQSPALSYENVIAQGNMLNVEECKAFMKHTVRP
jgi:hypothetical protein